MITISINKDKMRQIFDASHFNDLLDVYTFNILEKSLIIQIINLKELLNKNKIKIELKTILDNIKQNMENSDDSTINSDSDLNEDSYLTEDEEPNSVNQCTRKETKLNITKKKSKKTIKKTATAKINKARSNSNDILIDNAYTQPIEQTINDFLLETCISYNITNDQANQLFNTINNVREKKLNKNELNNFKSNEIEFIKTIARRNSKNVKQK